MQESRLAFLRYSSYSNTVTVFQVGSWDQACRDLCDLRADNGVNGSKANQERLAPRVVGVRPLISQHHCFYSVWLSIVVRAKEFTVNLFLGGRLIYNSGCSEVQLPPAMFVGVSPCLRIGLRTTHPDCSRSQLNTRIRVFN